MASIALANRVTTYSESAFIACTTLPVRQTMLNQVEMSCIDGLWDWGDFASTTIEGAVVGAVSGAVIGAFFAPALPAYAKIVATAMVSGAAYNAGKYIYKEVVGDNP